MKKILKIGADFVKLGTQLVSVTENYPFWKVNLNTLAQYFKAFLADIRESVINQVNLTPPDALQGIQIGAITSIDGIHIYTIPSTATAIQKINTVTGAITYIGNFSGATKFSGGVVRGNFAYFTPFTATFILKLDLRNDAVTTFGSLVGASKFGKPCLAQNGNIYAPPMSSTSWLIIEPDDTIRLVAKVVAGSFSSCVDGGNGFVYGCAGSVSAGTIKFNLTTEVSTILTTLSTGTIPYGDICNVNGVLFLAPRDFSQWAFINTLDDSITFMAHPGSALGFKHLSCKLGADGYVYFPTSANNASSPSFKINSLNFTLESLADGAVQYSGLAYGKNGKIFFTPAITASRVAKQVTNALAENLQDNMFLSRYINKG